MPGTGTIVSVSATHGATDSTTNLYTLTGVITLAADAPAGSLTVTAGDSLTLTFQVRVDAAGILYNVATVPSYTALICTSIPAKLCAGDKYELRAPPGLASYRWYKNEVLIQDETTNVLIVSQAGSYRVFSGLPKGMTKGKTAFEENPLSKP